VLWQLRRDPRTVALLLLVPCVLMTLMKYVLEGQEETFDRVGVPLLGIFPFISMFLVTSITMLRERTTGTLERLMTMPIAKLDLLAGYAGAFALMGALQAALVSLLGFGALLFGATTVFAQMQASLNDFWGVVAKPTRGSVILFLQTRLVSLGLVFVIGFLLLISFVITTALAAATRYAESWIAIPPAVLTAVDLVLSLVVITVLFATIFKILPDVNLRWQDMWRGAFITALLFVAGQSLISLYLTRTAPGSTYGAAGSLVLLLFWVYYSALILFFGVALTRATINLRGDQIVPKPNAARFKLDVLEEQENGRMKKVDEVE